MTTKRLAILFALSGAVLAAFYYFYWAGPVDRIILLPQADGTPSAVVVQSKSGVAFVLERPYSVATVGTQRIGVEKTDEAAVKTRYKELFDAFPQRPRSFRLFFESGGIRLMPESEERLPLIVDALKDLTDLPASELILIGHADDVGSDTLNDALSRRRAESIASTLKAKHIDTAHVAIVGRGSRDPLVSVKEGSPEARNRRVEIRLK